MYFFSSGSKSKVASNASNQPPVLKVKPEPGVSLLSFRTLLLISFAMFNHLYALVSGGYWQKEV
jgi:hypothetical protein